MRVSTDRIDSAVVVRASGDVDYVTAPKLSAAIQGALAERPRLAVIDLLGVRFFGSAGLTLLVEAKRTVERSVHVRLVASAAVVRPVQLTGLESIFEICPTVDEALASPLG